MRVGVGFDAHRFGGDPPVPLAGVVVDDTRGVLAHSDGDVLAHAIVDALLGAAALGDIGTHFPTGDDRWRDADSMELLRLVVGMLAEGGYAPIGVDATVVCQTIRLAQHREEMRQSLAAALDVDASAVSVKATTTDGMGAIGADEGIAAYAVAVVRPAG